MVRRNSSGKLRAVLALLGVIALVGCGATKNRVATEQLLVSNAVDRAIAHIDFSGLSGQKVYLDTKYIQHIRQPNPPPNSVVIINSDYITSSLRQQLLAAGVLVQEKLEDADYVVEVRCGAIGSDSHEVVYGLPANNLLNSAAALAPNAPALPPIPEIAVAKRNDQYGAAKIGVFAYHRTTKEPVWQAGIAQARSTSKDIWLFGAGPFQRGSIYDAPRFAGSKLHVPLLPLANDSPDQEIAKFKNEASFPACNDAPEERSEKQATHVTDAPDASKPQSKSD